MLETLSPKHEPMPDAIQTILDKIAAFRETIWKSRSLAQEIDAFLDKLGQVIDDDVREELDEAMKIGREEVNTETLLTDAIRDVAEAIEEVVDATPDAELRPKLILLAEKIKVEVRAAGAHDFDSRHVAVFTIAANGH